jgi:hypothetical protein
MTIVQKHSDGLPNLCRQQEIDRVISVYIPRLDL